jgi:hypothetical protein
MQPSFFQNVLLHMIEPSDKSGPSRVENRTNLQPCRFKERYTSDNDSDSTDDDSIAVAYQGFRTLRRTVRSTAGKHSNTHHEPMSVRINTLNDFVVFGVTFMLDFITSFNMIT